MTFIIDTAGNFHPYECGGPEEGCPHCQRAVTERHDPARCGLCDPEYDGRPNPWREAVAGGEPSIPFLVAVEAMAKALYEQQAEAHVSAKLAGVQRSWDDPGHIVASGPVSLDLRDEWRLAASHALKAELGRLAAPVDVLGGSGLSAWLAAAPEFEGRDPAEGEPS